MSRSSKDRSEESAIEPTSSGTKVRGDAPTEAAPPSPNSGSSSGSSGGTYVVASGRSVNAPGVGTLGEGKKVTVAMFDGDQATVDRLVAQGTLEKA